MNFSVRVSEQGNGQFSDVLIKKSFDTTKQCSVLRKILASLSR